MERLIVVSADCHADPAALAAYGPHLEAKYRDEYREYLTSLPDELGGQGQESRTKFYTEGHRRKLAEAATELAPEDGSARAVAGTSLSLTSDPDVRLKELEADGVVAEVLFVNTPWPFAPRGLYSFRAMMDDQVSARQRELEVAGLRAYHRWIGELCRAHPGRRVGIGVLGPVYDVDDTLSEIDFMAHEGLGGVMCPPPTADVPPLVDPFYDRIWSKCEELEFPLHVHLGWGGHVDPRLHALIKRDSPGYNPSLSALVRMEMRWMGRRALWLLIFGGVLERHPNLRVVLTELRSDWVSTYLREMDAFSSDRLMVTGFEPGTLSLRPSEYWHRQCFVGASSMSRAEIELRHETGIETMMFGTDYPHNEGTWPTTSMWLKRVFEDVPGGVPEADVRQMLGENAIRCYNLDRAQLAAAANTCGPRLDEVLGGTGDLDQETIGWLDSRGATRPIAFV